MPAYEKHIFPRKGGGGGRGGGGRGRGGSGGSKGSPASGKHAPSSFTNSRFSNSFKLSGTKSTASPYSDGGGKSFKLKSGRFSGRMSGSGKRQNVYGTRTYGSGYPYGASGYYLSYRPFPYYFYPVYLQEGYYGSDELANLNSTDRPGGNLVAAIVQPSYNTSSVTYRIVGDNSSVTAVFAALVANCSVANSTDSIYAFTPSSSSANATTWPVPEQVIQWYRASSFGLSLDGYNNTAALASNQPPSNSSTNYTRLPDSPLPDGLNTTFLQCINYTIGESVPLMDKPPTLGVVDIIQIVLWSLQVIILIAGITYRIWCRWKLKKQSQASAAPIVPPTDSAQNSSTDNLLAVDGPAGSRPTTPGQTEQV